MENHPDPEYQRIHLLRAIRHAQIDASELWLHYFGLAGDAGEYEVEAYLHGSFALPPLQRDLLAHAANELIDRLPQPPRAPYSTDLVKDDEPADGGEAADRAATSPEDPDGHVASSLDWLLRTRSRKAPDLDPTAAGDGPVVSRRPEDTDGPDSGGPGPAAS